MLTVCNLMVREKCVNGTHCKLQILKKDASIMFFQFRINLLRPLLRSSTARQDKYCPLCGLFECLLTSGTANLGPRFGEERFGKLSAKQE